MYLTKNFMDKEFLQLNNKINKETITQIKTKRFEQTLYQTQYRDGK